MTRYILSPAAQSSLINIKKHSIEAFGIKQTRSYLRAINQKLRDLAENPAIGIRRDEIKAGYCSAFVGSHTIYFRITSDGIEVIDVLHQSMEPFKHL